MKIEVGAGTKGHDGYVRVDAVDLPGVDVVDDGRWLETFDDGAADEIFSHWFFEHVAGKEIPRMLSAWQRVLRPGGLVRIVTNNHEAHNRCLQQGEITWEEWTYLIYAVSHQDSYTIWDLHKSASTADLLNNTLDACGFEGIEVDAQWKCRQDDGALKCPALIAVGKKPLEPNPGVDARSSTNA